jgi:Oxoglutarate and iron-dependent oxygenase degradation C-term
MLRLSQLAASADADDTAGALLRSIQAVFSSSAFKQLLQQMTGLDDAITQQRSVARRFRPGLDYTLATPAPWDCGADSLVLDAVLCFVGEFWQLYLYMRYSCNVSSVA